MNTLAEVISFVQSRTDMSNRADALREINAAWQEIWTADDLPNSVFEITVKPTDGEVGSRITLPYFVGQIRAVKGLDRIRVDLNTPRPYYQDETYFQSPYRWRILGKSPLKKSITNATRIVLSIPEPVEEQFTVTLQGPTDYSTRERDQIVFAIGDTEHEVTKNFTDLTDLSKDKLIPYNVQITSVNGDDYGIIPADAFTGLNTIAQVTDKCYTCCMSCKCFDVLYKVPPPILYYDEQVIECGQVLMLKTLEWISMPKKGEEKQTIMYSEKAKSLLVSENHDERSVSKKMDIAANNFYTWTAYGVGSSRKL